MGVFGNLAGMVNDRSRGFFDKQRKFRQNKRAQTFQNSRNSNRFKGKNALSRRLNRGIGYTTNLDKAGVNPMKARANMRAALAERDLAGMQENMEKNAAFKPFIGNDDLLAAATAGRGTTADAKAFLQSKGQSGKELQQNLSHITRAKESMGERQFAMASAVANASTGTGYGGGAGEMLDTLMRASGGDASLYGNMLAQAKSKAEGARRYDLAGAGYGDMYGQMQAIGRAANPADHAAAVEHANAFLADRALDTQGPGAMLGGRGQSVQNLIPAMQRRLVRSREAVEAVANGTPEMVPDGAGGTRAQTMGEARRQFEQSLASTAGLLDVAAQVSPENARMLADGLLSGNVDLAAMPAGARDAIATNPDGTRTVATNETWGQMIERYRQSNDFNEMRREYGAQQMNQYRSSQAAAQGTPGVTPPVIP